MVIGWIKIQLFNVKQECFAHHVALNRQNTVGGRRGLIFRSNHAFTIQRNKHNVRLLDSEVRL
jgi:hypothetical protein